MFDRSTSTVLPAARAAALTFVGNVDGALVPKNTAASRVRFSPLSS